MESLPLPMLPPAPLNLKLNLKLSNCPVANAHMIIDLPTSSIQHRAHGKALRHCAQSNAQPTAVGPSQTAVGR